MSKHHYIQFLQSFIQQPKQVGSIVPSSRFLAGKMVNAISWDKVRTVAELGSGTGAITCAIAKHSPKNTKVFLFEMDETMRRNLEKNYPHFNCHSNACQLVEIIHREGIRQLDCIISGLPFFNFKQDIRETLLDQVYQALKPGGLFVAFQYSLQMKKSLSEKFVVESIGLVPFNVPPAFVYTCRKVLKDNLKTGSD
ncbi:class I SAM-dependent methyltransferase [Paenibacillus paridis]|uniref:class I SAM-dependent methyltransferase n=1 Tax=Paenibacillus paridis TaxID=2583376 RepID=UPI001122A68E|nr:methyltransferase [Paenibacillus paridis]